MHDHQRIERVLELAAEGLTASAIAKATGTPRSTVRDWVAGAVPRSAREVSGSSSCQRGSACLLDRPRMAPSYAYMLGMYLGDGCISELRRGVHSLRISLDARYPELVFECRMRLQIICPDNRVGLVPMSGGKQGVVVQAYSKHWPCLFPQHGPGRKHERDIVLTDWQRQLVNEEPEMLLRGLVHSDGCRNINNRGRGSRWTGVRYLFHNRSDEIRQLFCDACSRLDIHWTQPDLHTISVARRGDTARLDTFIGPKR